MTPDVSPEQTMTRSEAAQHLGVTIRTIDGWIRGGRLVALKNELTREVRITAASVTAEKSSRAARAAAWAPVAKTAEAAA